MAFALAVVKGGGQIDHHTIGETAKDKHIGLRDKLISN